MEQDNQRILPVFLGRNIKDNLGNPHPLVLTTILFVTAFYNTIKFFIEGDRFRSIITLRYWSVPITHPTFWMFLVDGLLVFLSSLTFIGQLQIYVRLRSEEPITFSASLIVILFVFHFIAYLIGLVFWVLFPGMDILYSLILIAFIWSAIIIKGLM